MSWQHGRWQRPPASRCHNGGSPRRCGDAARWRQRRLRPLTSRLDGDGRRCDSGRAAWLGGDGWCSAHSPASRQRRDGVPWWRVGADGMAARLARLLTGHGRCGVADGASPHGTREAWGGARGDGGAARQPRSWKGQFSGNLMFRRVIGDAT